MSKVDERSQVEKDLSEEIDARRVLAGRVDAVTDELHALGGSLVDLRGVVDSLMRDVVERMDSLEAAM